MGEIIDFIFRRKNEPSSPVKVGDSVVAQIRGDTATTLKDISKHVKKGGSVVRSKSNHALAFLNWGKPKANEKLPREKIIYDPGTSPKKKK